MMRRFATILIAFTLILGGAVTSCFAAIANVRALECCSKDCPRPPAHNAADCCGVGTATQDTEVAPGLQLTIPDSSAFFVAIGPVPASFVSVSSPHLAMHLAHWSPPSNLTRSVVCSLQI
jgi:hypothetical protein